MNLQSLTAKPLVALAALATIGGGAGLAAVASAATSTATQTTSTTQNTGMHMGMRGMMGGNGVFGKITAISGNTITIEGRGQSGTAVTYTVDASGATVEKGQQGAAPTAATLSTLAVGDMIGVQGTVSGTSVTATKIISGMPGGMHGGRGHGVQGTVSAVSGNTITVTGRDGTTYTVDASAAQVGKVSTVSVSDIKVGDTVGVQGTISGTSVAAQHIMDGVPQEPKQGATTN